MIFITEVQLDLHTKGYDENIVELQNSNSLSYMLRKLMTISKNLNLKCQNYLEQLPGFKEI